MADPKKLKPGRPRGFEDRSPAEIRATQRMVEAIREVYERYGFEPVETPAVEFTEALGKFLPDQDRPNEGVFSFQDEDEQWLSLRYDLTAPLARYVAENWERLPKPYRSYRQGWVFRNEKPGPGRFRQFMQFDADTVGAPSVAADAEMCMMAADCLEALGIPRGQYVIKVNNRKVLDGVMEAIGLGGEENAGRRLQVLRAVDKLDRLGFEGVRALLTEGRLDESGDFTRGAELPGVDAEYVLEIFGPERLSKSVWRRAAAEPERAENDMQQAIIAGDRSFKDSRRMLEMIRLPLEARGASTIGIDELAAVAEFCEAAGYGSRRVQVDSSVVRGLEYYTGPVYEAELTFETVNDEGQKVRFGSVGGGGRYDGLVSRFRGEAVPATGFSIGVSRLQAALGALGKLGEAGERGPVVVLVLDRDRAPDYQKLVSGLRNAGVRAEMYLGAAGLKAQMKYADRRNSPCVVIQGSDERARNEVQVKDLIEGARLARGIEGHEAYREARPAQVTVPEGDLVATVREILARHA